MNIYLLAEPADDILKRVFSGKFQNPQIDYLFDGTEIESLKEGSPILVQDKTASKKLLQDILESYSGILISTQHSKEYLLAHLRHILQVYFKPDQQAIFRYYDPIITQYFFAYLNEKDTTQWLGPINSLEWYCNTWRDRVYEQNYWQQKNNLQANAWIFNQDILKIKPFLEKRHIHALEEMQQEKLAYKWQQNQYCNITQANIDQVIYWVKEAIHIGCWADEDIESYLNIRSKHPTRSLPENLASKEIGQKLADIEHYFQTTV